MAVLYQFGTYAYPKSTILAVPREMTARTRFADTPGRSGQYTQGGLVAARQWQVSGHLVPEAGDSLDALVDALFAAHAPGTPKALYTGRDDRYSLAEVAAFKQMDDDKYPGSLKWEAGFVASDPFLYAATETTDSDVGSETLTVSGTAETPPVWTLTVSGGTAGTSYVSLTNTTTGKEWRVLKATGEDVYIVDCANHQVRLPSGVDVTHLFSGSFWELQPGVNALTRNTGGVGGMTITTNALVYRGRWY